MNSIVDFGVSAPKNQYFPHGKSPSVRLHGGTFGVPDNLSHLHVGILAPPMANTMQVSYNIQIRSRSSALMTSFRMPYIWLSNRTDTHNGALVRSQIASSNLESAVPWFAPYWQLRPGFHLDAEAGRMIRRFVSSSLFHDVIALMQPAYDEFSIYPITTNTVATLENSTLATASISLSFQQKMSLLTSRGSYQSTKFTDMEICDYIEDYRSSTVFDIVGSVGGLFALLQSLHVLLFGQPMLWGLTRAKLIAPFGLFGVLSTRGYKKRLREQYHQPALTPDPSPAEVIRMSAFLRDFVIDFGPADVESKHDSVDTKIEPSTTNVLPTHEPIEWLKDGRSSAGNSFIDIEEGHSILIHPKEAE
ncbi:hypothetical protein BDV93DRAFT_566212 [Ceratobasidium sp. AG-I]|nr:hypothetical protein BDV93DRAFT_566212 [Ceratobasidium sp. AG-I]